MSTGDNKRVVHFLLTQLTATLLAKSPVKDHLQKAALSHQNALRAKLTAEEYEPILLMRDVIAVLAVKLAGCIDVETLEQTHAYIQALNEGEVMVAVENDQTGEVERYETNR